MTAIQGRASEKTRQATQARRSTLSQALKALALAVFALGCAAPISTMRSPFHLRVVELRNTTHHPWVLEVAPVEGQKQLGGATTFTGELQPGEVKVLYLYHGFEYEFVVREMAYGRAEVARAVARVDRDVGFDFAGDALVKDEGLVVRLGEPAVSFADSLTRAQGDIMPDTARGRFVPADTRQRQEQERRNEAERRRRGETP